MSARWITPDSPAATEGDSAAAGAIFEPLTPLDRLVLALWFAAFLAVVAVFAYALLTT